MPCLDANRIVLYLAAGLSEEETQAVRTHISACEDCLELMGILVDSDATAAENTIIESTSTNTANPTVPTDEVFQTTFQPLSPNAKTVIDSESPSIQISPGQQLGRYRLGNKLGQGGMGIVYAASDSQMNRDVAIKFVNSDIAYSELLAEARSMARIQHPNVVAVFEIESIESNHFVVMERIEGIDIRKWLALEEDWRLRLNLLLEAGQGLAAAHANGVIHRDFKPENMMTDGHRVQVLDFGLARSAALSENGDASGLKSTFAGTPLYMAPERYRSEPSTELTDQFSYAVALFEAAHGCRPFRGANIRELRKQILAGQYRTTNLNPDIPRAVQKVIGRGLSIDPADRFPSMDALLAALQSALAPKRPKQRFIAAILGMVAAVTVVFGLQYFRGAWPHSDRDTTTKIIIPNESKLPEPLPAPLKNDPMGVTIHRLSNGITVYISTNLESPTLDASLVVRVGARNDPPGASGAAHLLGRMMYRGTDKVGTSDFSAESVHLKRIAQLYTQLQETPSGPRRDVLVQQIEAESRSADTYVIPDEYRKTAQKLGIEHDHEVTQTATHFSAHMLSNRFAIWAKMEAERITKPVFRQFRSQLSLLLQEKPRNTPSTILRNWIDTAAGRTPVAGIPAELATEPFAPMQSLYRDWYHPNNVAIVLVGDIDANHALPTLEREFSHWRPKTLPDVSTETPAAPPDVLHVTAYPELTFTDARLWKIPNFTYKHSIYTFLLLRQRKYRTEKVGVGAINGYVFATSGGGDAGDENATLKTMERTLNDLQIEQSELNTAIEQEVQYEQSKYSNRYFAKKIGVVYGKQQSWREHWREWDELKSLTVDDLPELLALLRNVVPIKVVANQSRQAARISTTALPTHDSPIPSQWTANILQTKFPPISIKFEYAGKDFQVEQIGSRELIQIRSDDNKLMLHFDIGSLQLPLLPFAITAVIDGAIATKRWLHGAVEATNYADITAIDFTIPDTGTIASFWASILNSFDGSQISESGWKQTIRNYLETRRRLQRDPQRLLDTLNEYAVYRKDSTSLSVPSGAELLQTTAEDARRTLRQLAQEQPTRLYIGVPLQGMEAKVLRPDCGMWSTPCDKQTTSKRKFSAPVSRPEHIPNSDRPDIFALPWSSDSPMISLLVPLPNLSDRHHVTLQLLSLHWQQLSQRFSEQLGAPFHITTQYSTIDSDIVIIKCSVPRKYVLDYISALLQTIRTTDISDVLLVDAKQRLEEQYRSDWIPKKTLATRVFQWRRKGYKNDPRIARFGLLHQINHRDIQEMQRMMSTRMVFSILGDLAPNDLVELQNIGDVHHLEPADIMHIE